MKPIIYTVSFSWGNEYNNSRVGIKSVTINITGAANKFEALAQAFTLISPLVNGEEPTKLNATSTEQQ